MGENFILQALVFINFPQLINAHKLLINAHKLLINYS